MTEQSLPLLKRIVSYTDEISVLPGQTITTYVSCDPRINEFTAELVRLSAGQPGWEYDTPTYEVIPSSIQGAYRAEFQEFRPGAHIRVPTSGRSLPRLEQCTLAVLVQPTLATGTRQVLLAIGDLEGDSGLALVLDEELRPALVGGHNQTQLVAVGAPLTLNTWTRVAASFQANGLVGLSVRDEAGVETLATSDGPRIRFPSLTSQDVTFAARLDGAGQVRDAFTGLLERPTIFSDAIPEADVDRWLMTPSFGSNLIDVSERVFACWDFSRGIGTWTATDIGPNELHGSLHNLPMRAVRGWHWVGNSDEWTTSPDQYAAIHFHADAIEDCRWRPAFTLSVPHDLASGFYAFRLSAGREVDFVPFFVRGSEDSSARVLFIVPTATYNSYANSRFWWENPIQEMVQDRLVEVGAEEQFLLLHPQLGLSSYDCHQDGTDVCYVSRRRPNLSMRPCHVRREGYTSDLYLVEWLNHIATSYDVATDEDLHRDGLDLLNRYAVVITGSHPEYMSVVMVEAFDAWVRRGGRIMYLGGNGFSSNINFDSDRPWIMENRRVDLWERDQSVQRSEGLNSTDGRRGGYFTAAGLRPSRLTGVESATMGFDHSYPYVLKPDARRPEAGFVFEGVTGEIIGDFGALGGGVVGQEWDNSAGQEHEPGHLLLASSRDHSLVPPMFGAVRPDFHADLVLYLHGPGAVFSASSMSWVGALGYNEFSNDISTITANVLRRFVDTAPFPHPHQGDPV